MENILQHTSLSVILVALAITLFMAVITSIHLITCNHNNSTSGSSRKYFMHSTTERARYERILKYIFHLLVNHTADNQLDLSTFRPIAQSTFIDDPNMRPDDEPHFNVDIYVQRS